MVKRRSLCLCRYSFFGLTQEYRFQLFKQIHEIVFHGKGGFDWHTVYNMPIWLRKFTFKQIQDFYNEEKSSIENKGQNGKQTVIDSEGKILDDSEINEKLNTRKL